MGFWKKLGKAVVEVAEAAEEARREEAVVVPVTMTRGQAEDAGLIPRYGSNRRQLPPVGTVVEYEERDAYGIVRKRVRRIV